MGHTNLQGKQLLALRGFSSSCIISPGQEVEHKLLFKLVFVSSLNTDCGSSHRNKWWINDYGSVDFSQKAMWIIEWILVNLGLHLEKSVHCKMMSLSYKAAAEGVRLPWHWCQHWGGLVGAIQSTFGVEPLPCRRTDGTLYQNSYSRFQFKVFVWFDSSSVLSFKTLVTL